MNKNYLIIDKKVLPDYFEKVITAKEYVAGGMSVVEAVELSGISRSTFYKYKDYVFRASGSERNAEKAIIQILLKHKSGVMLKLYEALAKNNVNIISLNQSMAINNAASVEITMDLKDMVITVDELLKNLEAMDDILKVHLIAIESL